VSLGDFAILVVLVVIGHGLDQIRNRLNDMNRWMDRWTDAAGQDFEQILRRLDKRRKKG
jgi:hypothetical protein